MRRYPEVIGCALTACALVMTAVPTASADNITFVTGARALGFQQTDNTLIRMARSACRMLQPNLRRNPEEIVEHVVRYSAVEPPSIPPEGREPERVPDARQFVALSVREYCPDLAYRVPA